MRKMRDEIYFIAPCYFTFETQPLLFFYFPLSIVLFLIGPLYLSISLFIFREVSWCSWLSHHFYVVRVPGSNPGGTIFTYHIPFYLPLLTRPPPWVPFPTSIIGRFISSRIHPFPSEHGSKDA